MAEKEDLTTRAGAALAIGLIAALFDSGALTEDQLLRAYSRALEVTESAADQADIDERLADIIKKVTDR